MLPLPMGLACDLFILFSLKQESKITQTQTTLYYITLTLDYIGKKITKQALKNRSN